LLFCYDKSYNIIEVISLNEFKEYLDTLQNELARTRFTEVFDFIENTFPALVPVIKWNQPMFLDHNSFIIGFSATKNYMSISLEKPTQDFFLDQIVSSGYNHTNNLFQITWKQEVNYPLLQEMIQKNMEDKKNITSFWRT